MGAAPDNPLQRGNEMRSLRTLAALLLASVPLASAPAAAQAQPRADSCDEACLTDIMQRYLDALAKRAPADAPLAANVIATENEQLVAPGDGLWGTISGLGSYRHIFADPKAGSVAAFVALKEQGVGALATIRLQVSDRRITEAETIIARGEGTKTFLKSEYGPVKPIFGQIVPPEKRLSRSELVRITDGYFEAIEQSRSSAARFHPECNRTENGIQTTNNPALGSGTETSPARGCASQIDAGVFSYITQIDPRRYLLIDESRNLVFGVFMFRHEGRLTEVDVPGRGKVEMIDAAKRPFNVVVGEAFRIEDGQIREIEAVMTELPYRTPTLWKGTLAQ